MSTVDDPQAEPEELADLLEADGPHQPGQLIAAAHTTALLTHPRRRTR